VVVDEPGLRTAVAEQLQDMVMNRFVTTAPVLIALVAEAPDLIPRLAGHLKNKPYYLMDIGMAVENLCLQAADEGLGSCIIGWFDEPGVKKLIGVPKRKRVPLVISLGYQADPAIRPKQRKSWEEICSYNAYRREK
jgi:nitroreductase